MEEPCYKPCRECFGSSLNSFTRIQQSLLLRNAFTYFSERPSLGQRFKQPDGTLGGFTWMTYKELFQRSLAFGSGLRELVPARFAHRDLHLFHLLKSISPSRSVIGLCSLNRFEYYIADYGAMFFNNIVVPIHTIYGEDSLEIVLNNCEASVVVCDIQRAEKFLSLTSKGRAPSLKSIILMDPISDDQLQALRTSVSRHHLMGSFFSFLTDDLM